MYKLTVFIPDEALEQVKSALFAAGAGSIGCDRTGEPDRGPGRFFQSGGGDHLGGVHPLRRPHQDRYRQHPWQEPAARGGDR